LAATEVAALAPGVNVIPGPLGLPILVRSCYRDLEQLILDIWAHPNGLIKRHALVLGIPGIGKSLFLRYMLWVILRRPRERPLAIHFLSSSGAPGTTTDAFMIFVSANSVVVSRALMTAPLWPGDINTERYSFADGCNPVAATASLEVSSPQLLRYQSFEKQLGVETLYMPGFSLAELFQLREVRFPTMSEDLVRERYHVLGGTARLVLDQASKEPTSLIHEGFGRTSIDALMRGLEANDVTHRLLHFSVEPSYTLKSPMFCSPYVRHEVAKDLKASHQNYVSWLCDTSQNSNYLGTLRGRLFEDWVVERFCDGGRFKWRPAAASNDEPELFVFEPGTKLCDFDAVEEIHSAPDDAIARPISLSFGGVDLIRQGRDLFNATYDMRHRLSLSALTKVAAAMRPGNQPLRFFWVVPRDSYARMKPQRFHDTSGHVVDDDKLPEALRTMEQYVLEVPLVDLQLLAQHSVADDQKYLDDDDLALTICGFAEPESGKEPCPVRPVSGNRRCAAHKSKRIGVKALRSYLESKKRKFGVSARCIL